MSPTDRTDMIVLALLLSIAIPGLRLNDELAGAGGQMTTIFDHFAGPGVIIK